MHAIKWVAVAVAITNGYPTHFMTMPLPLPLPPPQCEHPHCIPGNPLDSNDVVAVAVVQCERTFNFNRLYQICEETIKLHKTAVLGSNYWRCVCLSLYHPGYFKTDQADFAWTHSRVILLVARWSHLSGCFWLFPQNFGMWWGPTNCHFDRKGIQLQWCWQC